MHNLAKGSYAENGYIVNFLFVAHKGCLTNKEVIFLNDNPTSLQRSINNE